MTAEAIEVLDLPTGDKVLEIWDKELPWATKLEGIALFDMSLSFEERILSAPGMVSRRLVVIDGILWEPLVNFSRCFRKLVHEEQRTVEEEYQLVESAYSTCCLQIYWHMVGKIYSPCWKTFCESLVESSGNALQQALPRGFTGNRNTPPKTARWENYGRKPG
jgi:hypothetical protein